MKKTTKHLVALVLTLVVATQMLSAQIEQTTMNKRTYTRSSGYFIRPEVYGGYGAEFGYQFSPYFQLSGGPLVEVDVSSGEAFMEFLLGVRAYASETKWTAFFDYHISLVFIYGYAVPLHRFSVGPSFKNFDFGVGIGYSSGYWSPVITIGHNFRLHSNR